MVASFSRGSCRVDLLVSMSPLAASANTSRLSENPSASSFLKELSEGMSLSWCLGLVECVSSVVESVSLMWIGQWLGLGSHLGQFVMAQL